MREGPGVLLGDRSSLGEGCTNVPTAAAHIQLEREECSSVVPPLHVVICWFLYMHWTRDQT